MKQEVYRQRFRVVDGCIALGDSPIHDGFDLVVGAMDDPHAVEAALAMVAFGPKLVGLDWADVKQAAGGGPGRAHVAPRVFDVARELTAARDVLIASGFGLSFLFVQLPDHSDWREYTLRSLDELTGDLFANIASPVLFTAAHGWLWSRSVLIGFGHDPRD